MIKRSVWLTFLRKGREGRICFIKDTCAAGKFEEGWDWLWVGEWGRGAAGLTSPPQFSLPLGAQINGREGVGLGLK